MSGRQTKKDAIQIDERDITPLKPKDFGLQTHKYALHSAQTPGLLTPEVLEDSRMC